MKALFKQLVLIAGCAWLAAGARAQEKPAIRPQQESTNTISGIALDFSAQPTITWGDHVHVSGLFVDFVQPEKTWSLLDPSTPPPKTPPARPELAIPPVAPAFERDGNVGSHGPGFAILKFNFP